MYPALYHLSAIILLYLFRNGNAVNKLFTADFPSEILWSHYMHEYLYMFTSAHNINNKTAIAIQYPNAIHKS